MIDFRAASVLTPLLLAGIGSGAHAALVTTEALLVEGDILNGQAVATIDGASTNAIGGFAVQPDLTQSGSNGTSVIFGSATRGEGSVLLVEGTVAGFPQNNIETNFGISDAGVLAYSATTASPTRDAVFTTGGFNAIEGEALPAGSPLAGNFYGDAQNAPSMAGDGTFFWVGEYRATSGGANIGTAIFQGPDANVLLKTGDALSGITGTVGNDGFQFGGFAISVTGDTYITQVDLAGEPTGSDQVLVINGSAVSYNGTVLREGSTLPGLPGVTYSSFSKLAVNDAQQYVVGGLVGTAGGSEFALFVNGELVWIDGGTIDGQTLDTSTTPGVDINEAGDWVAVVSGAIVLNGEVILQLGDLVDTDGDGTADAALDVLLPAVGIAISERLDGGLVDIYAIAKAGGVDREILLRTSTIIPEPASLVLLGLGGLAVLRRRA